MLFGRGTAVELEAKSVGVVEPDVLPFAVGVDADSAVLQCGVVEVVLDLPKVGGFVNSKGDVILTGLLFVVWGRCVARRGCEEELCFPDLKHDSVFALE